MTALPQIKQGNSSGASVNESVTWKNFYQMIRETQKILLKQSVRFPWTKWQAEMGILPNWHSHLGINDPLTVERVSVSWSSIAPNMSAAQAWPLTSPNMTTQSSIISVFRKPVKYKWHSVRWKTSWRQVNQYNKHATFVFAFDIVKRM